MVEITASQVNELRKQTGLGMMDCKSALVDARGDFDKAIEILRKKGQKVAMKRAEREVNEGVVISGINKDSNLGAMLILNCETDFVAKNEDFIDFAKQILSSAIDDKESDLDSITNLFKDKIIEQTGIIGEKISLSYFECVASPFVISYVHPGNKLASIVSFNSKLDIDVARNIAMQIAAMNPIAVDENNVSKDVLEKEYNIGLEQAKEEGKPEQILEKIAEGKLKKFLKENTLLNQSFIKDNSINVEAYLNQNAKDVKILEFRRVGLGY